MNGPGYPFWSGSTLRPVHPPGTPRPSPRRTMHIERRGARGGVVGVGADRGRAIRLPKPSLSFRGVFLIQRHEGKLRFPPLPPNPPRATHPLLLLRGLTSPLSTPPPSHPRPQHRHVRTTSPPRCCGNLKAKTTKTSPSCTTTPPRRPLPKRRATLSSMGRPKGTCVWWRLRPCPIHAPAFAPAQFDPPPPPPPPRCGRRPPSQPTPSSPTPNETTGTCSLCAAASKNKVCCPTGRTRTTGRPSTRPPLRAPRPSWRTW